MSDEILSIQGLCKVYRGFRLDDVTLSVRRGTVMGFIGRNGAGKSTTIKSVLAMIPVDAGTITVNGLDNRAHEIAVKQSIGYVGEDARLYSGVRCSDVARFVSRFYRDWDESHFRGLSARFGLDLSKKVGSLSNGTRTKFALSLALAHHPELLVLDEPTSGLDPVVRNELLEILMDAVRHDGSSVFFSSHITEDIARIADDVTYIDNGRILLSASKQSIIDGFRQVDFRASVPAMLQREFRFLRESSCIVDDMMRFSALTDQAGLVPDDYEVKAAALDDVLMLLIDRENDYAAASRC